MNRFNNKVNDQVYIDHNIIIKKPKSKKQHKCSWCGDIIEIGEIYSLYMPESIQTRNRNIYEKFHNFCYNHIINDYHLIINGFERFENFRIESDNCINLKAFTCKIWYGGDLYFRKLTNKTINYCKEDPIIKEIKVIAHSIQEAEKICVKQYYALDILNIILIGDANSSEAKNFSLKEVKIDRLDFLLNS